MYVIAITTKFIIIVAVLVIVMLASLLTIYMMSMKRINVVRKALAAADETNALLEKTIESVSLEKKKLESLAAIYHTMHIIDIQKGTFEDLGGSSVRINKRQKELTCSDLQEKLYTILREVTLADDLDRILKFHDLSTLKERMEGVRFVACEARTDAGSWRRFMFIRVGGLEDEINKVILTTQDIDLERKEKEKLIKTSFIDGLTGVYNRNAFVAMLKEIEENEIPLNMWFMEADVNGLKVTNDNLGHAAGDELIKGVANILGSAVEGYGSVYRTGGDEFICVLTAKKQEMDDILSVIDKKMSEWQGAYLDTLSFSKGYVCASELSECTVTELSKEADKRMYADKRRYYEENGSLDRRHPTSYTEDDNTAVSD